MTTLVFADHDNKTLKSATLNAITAAMQLGETHLLVAGHDCRAVAETGAKISGVSKVLLADDARYEHALAEPLAVLIAGLASGYSHVLAPATTSGKNVMPRVAALLDVAQISDIIGIDSEDAFKRPIYAGNAIATVQSRDSIKVITVRGTAFEAAASEGERVPVTLLSPFRGSPTPNTFVRLSADTVSFDFFGSPYLAWVDVSEVVDRIGAKRTAEEETRTSNRVVSPEQIAQRWFAENARVFLNPGHSYGAGGAGRMRMNIASPRSLIHRALDNLAEALATV